MVDYGDSGAPILGEIDDAERQRLTADAQAVNEVAEGMKDAEVVPAPEGFVAYAAAAEFSNAEFLVKSGEPVPMPIQAGHSSSIRPLIRRDGDIKATFVEGVLATDDTLIIEWCDAHPTICRRTSDPMTKNWLNVKELQARLSTRERLVDPTEMNPDEAFPPGGSGDIATASKLGSKGSQLVESAEGAKRQAEAASA